jgi:lysophospholipase L1-like esterase
MKIILAVVCSICVGATLVLAQTEPAAALAKGSRYVALGSSFAAGPDIPRQLGTCGRSDHNYAHLVAAALELELTDVSCNGATTANILDTRQGEAAPQIQAVTSDTALVTVTIGGNDIRYTASTFACAGTAPEKHCSAGLDRAAIDTAVRQLPSRLEAVIDAVRARAPRAVVVVVTYPRVFTSDAPDCRELALSADDTAFLAGLGQKLEEAFVRTAANRDTLLADAYAHAGGHGACAARDARWVNGATPADTGAPFHPTAKGHVEMARRVQAALGRE